MTDLRDGATSAEGALDVGVAFDAEGHASELALSLLADGADELVPVAAREHADQCAACTSRLADFALLSLSVEGALLRNAAAARDAAPRAVASARFPAVAFAAVLAVPALTLLRQWLSSGQLGRAPLGRLFDLWALVRPLALTLDRGARHLDSSLPVTSVVSSLTFVLLGLAVVRLVRPVTLQGPVS